ncbi:ankyrin repeat-containing protein BDA1 [Eucalyptus grandis]|uniref:ankyrin repeat-containing protein BDA1 n=1 Tax=Eucalyptus grandis TaxID=71139 RepID=UPI00192EF712|nr:ankyrin repeat-containing protein BDA1 [Eucalyptus grandis]
MGKSLAKKGEQEARESQLQHAIANDDVDELHDLIVKEQALLDRVSKHPFPDTPLHLAAKAGKTQVAMEIAILKPSFAWKLNPEVDPSSRTIGITPLHYVAKKKETDELELLAEFLCACKSSIKDLTSQCETAVHIAIKNHNLKAFKVLFRWLKRVHLMDILAQEDQDGNTVYDIASTMEPQPEELKIRDVRNIQREEMNGIT